jgi:lipoate-protein ligase A
MPDNATAGSSMVPTGRLIPTLRADGYTQMALDRFLLERGQSGGPMLRFYQWDGPWLSIGRHQQHWPDHWDELVRSKTIAMVRRPSGGRAVLHAGGLTYALVWPDAPRKRQQAYRDACQWLIDGFNSLGLTLHFGDETASVDHPNCFARSTAADLVDQDGIKRIGSAQRWQHGCLLQHGEIMLDPPKALWQSIFAEPAPPPAPASVPRQGLDQHLSHALQHLWKPLDWTTTELSRQERDELASFVTSSSSTAF